MLDRKVTILFLAGTIDVAPLDASHAAFNIAADSGAEHARKFELPLDAIVGDLDSISSETLEWYRNQGTKILHVSEQEHNDFEKVLRYLEEFWKGKVRILGLSGGRMDHTLSNLSVMLRYSDEFEAVIAVDEFGSHSFLTTRNNSVEISCNIGTRISLTPFGEAIGITTSNLQYPLRKESLRLGAREGLSNVATGSPVSVSIERGALLVSVLK